MEKELSEMTLEELWTLFPIVLEEYNIDYKWWYEIEKEKLFNNFSFEDIVRINHIGSTAVEGLISKPIVDILLEMNIHCNIEKLKKILINDGWILMSSQDSPYMNLTFNKGYTNKGFAEKVYHLHVRYNGDWGELYFRDYLIENQEVAKKYGELKLELREKYTHHRDNYTEAKSEFILKYTEKAKKIYFNIYKPTK